MSQRWVVKKKNYSDELEAVITGNPVTTAREVVERFNVTSTEKDWKCFSGWKMGPTRPVPKEFATAFLLLWVNWRKIKDLFRSSVGKGLLLPPYFPNLCHSNYLLFWDCRIIWLTLREEVRHKLVTYFASKP